MALLVLPCQAQVADTSFDDAQQNDIGKIALDYLLSHPEFLDTLEQQRELRKDNQRQILLNDRVGKKALAHFKVLTATGKVPEAGPKDAKIIVVQFFDYQCAACGSNGRLMAQFIEANPQIRFIFMDWPGTAANSTDAETAAAIGLTLWKDKGMSGYLGYQQGVFASGQAGDKFQIEDIARGLKATGAPVPTLAKMSVARKMLASNAKIASLLGLNRVPTVIIMPAAATTLEPVTVLTGAISAQALNEALAATQK